MIAADGCSYLLKLLVGLLGNQWRSLLFFMWIRQQLGYDWLNLCPRYSSFIHRLQNKLEGGGERGEGCHPSDLLCWLTVIWSGAPTDSLGEVPTTQCLNKRTYWPKMHERDRRHLKMDWKCYFSLERPCLGPINRWMFSKELIFSWELK